jgi:hypothetical protein
MRDLLTLLALMGVVAACSEAPTEAVTSSSVPSLASAEQLGCPSKFLGTTWSSIGPTVLAKEQST